MTTPTDPVQVGVVKATTLGYTDSDTVAGILRRAESHEPSGFRVWMQHYPHDPTSFGVIMATVREEAQRQSRSAAWQAEQDTCRVLEDVRRERVAQRERYGLNETTPDGTGGAWLLPYTADPAPAIEAKLRNDYMDYAEDAPVTWVHLLREEMAEAFAETDPIRLRAELVQVAALAVSWCERLDARQG